MSLRTRLDYAAVFMVRRSHNKASFIFLMYARDTHRRIVNWSKQILLTLCTSHEGGSSSVACPMHALTECCCALICSFAASCRPSYRVRGQHRLVMAQYTDYV